MKNQIATMCTLLIFCFSTSLMSKSPGKQEEEFNDQEVVDSFDDDSFDEYDEDGIITSEEGPLGTDTEIDITGGGSETTSDRYDREESAFSGLSGFASDETVHAENH